MEKKAIKPKKTSYKSIRPNGRKQKITPSRAKDQSKYFFFMNNPVSKTYLDDLAEEMISWSEKNKAETVYKAFLSEKQIPYSVFKVWINHKNGNKLRAALEITKQMLGVTRERGMHLNQLNFKSISHNQHHYDPEWGEANEYHNELKQKVAEKESSGKQIVLMKEYKIDE